MMRKLFFLLLTILVFLFLGANINSPVYAQVSGQSCPTVGLTICNASRCYCTCVKTEVCTNAGYCTLQKIWTCTRSCPDPRCPAPTPTSIPPTVPPPGPLETPTPVPPTNTPTPVPPTPTPTSGPIPTWIINLAPVCPSGMTQKKPLRMFRIIWPQEGQQWYEFDCINDDHSIGNHTMEITPKNILNGVQGIYVGLEDEMRDGEARVCSEGISLEPSSIEPSVPVITGSYPTSGDFVVFAKYMNPYNWMAHWQWNRLTGGNYTIKFNLPDSMCEIIPTNQPIITITTPPGCTLKSKGDANCDNQINMADYEIWACQILGNATCNQPDDAANFDSINKVNLNDFEIWRRNTNTTPAATVLNCDWCGTVCKEVVQGENCSAIAVPPGSTCSYDPETNSCQGIWGALN